MKPENIQRLRDHHYDYYNESIVDLPDGWFGIVNNFLNAVSDVGDLVPSVCVRFERNSAGLRAFCFPEMQRWTADHDAAVRTAQLDLYAASQCTCTVCGRPGEFVQGSAAKGGADDILCCEHIRELFDDISQRRSFTRKLTAINPPVGGWPVDYPDNLSSTIQITLREINRVAVEYEVQGLVNVSQCKVRDGTLMMRVKFADGVPLGAQIEITDLVKGAESDADLIWQKGGSDDR